MAGAFGVLQLAFSRGDAAALPLTDATIETVIARTRTANLVQMLAAVVLVAGLLLAGRQTGAPLSAAFFGAAALAAWGLLATALSTWDHFRAAKALRGRVGLAPGTDPAAFWAAHRGLFPHFTR